MMVAPPLALIGAPNVPLPPRVAPESTVTALLLSVPLFHSVPAITRVVPLWVLVPVKVHAPVPTLLMLLVPPPLTMLPAKVVLVFLAPML